MMVYKDIADSRNFQATLLQTDLDRIVAQIPNDLIEEVKEKRLVIAGGFIRSILRGEPINDIDLFKVTDLSPVANFDTSDPFGPAIASDPIKAEAIQLSKDINVGVFFTTDNAISFEVYGHTDANPSADHVKVQYIIKYTSDTVKALLQKFDFTNSMAAIWHNGISWVSMCHNDFYGAIGNSQLLFNKDFRGDRVVLMKRFVKFTTSGWQYTIRDFAKIISAVSQEAVGLHEAYKLLCSSQYEVY